MTENLTNDRLDRVCRGVTSILCPHHALTLLIDRHDPDHKQLLVQFGQAYEEISRFRFEHVIVLILSKEICPCGRRNRQPASKRLLLCQATSERYVHRFRIIFGVLGFVYAVTGRRKVARNWVYCSKIRAVSDIGQTCTCRLTIWECVCILWCPLATIVYDVHMVAVVHRRFISPSTQLLLRWWSGFLRCSRTKHASCKCWYPKLQAHFALLGCVSSTCNAEEDLSIVANRYILVLISVAGCRTTCTYGQHEMRGEG